MGEELGLQAAMATAASMAGGRCNTRILRPLARILRAWSFYFHNLVIWTHNHLNRIYHSLSHSLSLSPVTSLSLPHLPHGFSLSSLSPKL